MTKPKRLNLRKDMTARDEINPSIYNLIMGLFLTIGLVITAIMSKVLPENYFFTKNFYAIAIFTVVATIIGIVIMRFANNVILITIGFLLLNVSIGFTVSLSMSFYKTEDIVIAVISTTAIAGIMTLLSTIFPRFFASIGRALFIGLLVLVITEILWVIIFKSLPTIFVIISVGIFSLYFGYDWYKAQSSPKTIKNAILSAGELYIDLINIFLDILELLDRK